MGLFGFGNKNREIKKANDFIKDQLIEKIMNLASECRDLTVKEKLNDLRKELEAQSSTEDKKAFSILKKIEEKVDDARTYIVDKNTSFALNVVSEAMGYAAERRKLCSSAGDLTSRDAKKQKEAEKLAKKFGEEKKEKAAPKTRIEQLKEEREETIKERNKHKAEKERLLGILQGLSYYDRDIEDQMFEAERAEQEAQIKLNDINAEITMEQNAAAMQAENRRFEQNQRDRTFSQDQIEMIQQDNEEMNKKKEEDLRRNLELQERRNANSNRHSEMQDSLRNASRGQGMQGASQGNPYARGGSATQSNPYATGGASANSNPYATGGAAAQSNPYATGGSNPYAQANPYGNNNNSPLGSKSDINKMISILTQSQAEYNKKLQKAQGELSDFDAELRSLLRRRQNATPSECLVLDGEIDQKKAQRATLTRTIQVYQNQNAQLSEQLAMMGKVEVQQDLEAVKNRIQQLTGGRYADIEGLSMYLKEAAQKENEELERFGIANSVADSEDINTRTMTGNNSDYMDSVNVKDEDKYAALEAELGLATR